MSRQSYTTNELVALSVQTTYSDDYGVRRGRVLRWRAFGWEGTVDLHPTKRWWRSLRWRFDAQHFPFEPEDSEGMYYEYLTSKREQGKVRT